ncbi:hypothetical protein [Nostoc sp. CALU 546]|uniref:hypothetical protein n=1 Tax=Nostoc sp. CALU 546 TaxID=1867241 RepID=UPI003B67B6D1
MKIGTVSVSYSRKFNLGNYESIELGCSLWAQVEDEEDADGVVQFLYHQAKAAVKDCAFADFKAVKGINSLRGND